MMPVDPFVVRVLFWIGVMTAFAVVGGLIAVIAILSHRAIDAIGGGR